MKPLREHFENETDAGTTLRTFDYISALESYVDILEQISLKKAYEEGYEDAFQHEKPDFESCKNEILKSKPTI